MKQTTLLVLSSLFLVAAAMDNESQANYKKALALLTQMRTARIGLSQCNVLAWKRQYTDAWKELSALMPYLLPEEQKDVEAQKLEIYGIKISARLGG